MRFFIGRWVSLVATEVGDISKTRANPKLIKKDSKLGLGDK